MHSSIAAADKCQKSAGKPKLCGVNVQQQAICKPLVQQQQQCKKPGPDLAVGDDAERAYAGRFSAGTADCCEVLFPACAVAAGDMTSPSETLQQETAVSRVR